MAATAMDPVDIANILAQELLYQQVMVRKLSLGAQRFSGYLRKTNCKFF